MNEHEQEFHNSDEKDKKTVLRLKQFKFNDKVRKANAKLKKRKKSKGRKSSKKRHEENVKSGSKNSSLNRLKARVNKRMTKSNLSSERVHDREDSHEEKYNPVKRGIGLDFLEFVKKKPAASNRLFLSTQKSSEWYTGEKLDKSKKKLRPSSAQHIENNISKMRSLEEPFEPNEDLEPQIAPINELPEEMNTNRPSDDFEIYRDPRNLEILKAKDPRMMNNFMTPEVQEEDKMELKPMKPVYQSIGNS